MPKPVVKAAPARPSAEPAAPGASFAHDRPSGKKKRKKPRGK
jgi:hypothetical protein